MNTMSRHGSLWIAMAILSLSRCEIIIHPSDTEAIVGGRIELKCVIKQHKSDFSVTWQHIPIRLNPQSDVINRNRVIIGACGPRCSIEGNQEAGEYNLVIKDVILEDAGQYICSNLLDQSEGNAQLVVFDSYPSSHTCTKSVPPDGVVGQNSCGIKPDTVVLTCSMSYKGNRKPTLKWSVQGQTKASEVGNSVISNISVKADELSSSNVTCYVDYPDSAIKSQLSWTTSLNVFSNHTRVIDVTNAEPLQLVDCALLTNHPCSYSWIGVNQNPQKLFPGSSLNLKDLPDGVYVCNASCTVRENSCHIQPVKINLSCSGCETPPAGAPVVIAVVIVLSTVAIVVIIILVICLRKRAHCFRKECPEDGNIKQPPVEVPLMEEENAKPKVEGLLPTQKPEEGTGETPDLLEGVRDANPVTPERPEDEIKDRQSVIQEDNMQTQDSTISPSDSDPNLTKDFVIIDLNADAIVERVEHRFPS